MRYDGSKSVCAIIRGLGLSRPVSVTPCSVTLYLATQNYDVLWIHCEKAQMISEKLDFIEYKDRMMDARLSLTNRAILDVYASVERFLYDRVKCRRRCNSGIE